MLQPFTFITDELRDKLAKFGITFMYPLSRIYTWFDQHETFIKEVEILFKRAVFFLEQDPLLKFTAKNDFVTTDKAQVCKADHAGFSINESHQIDFLSKLLRATSLCESF